MFILKVGQVHFFYYKLFTNKKNILSFIYIYYYLHFLQKRTCPTFKINGSYVAFRLVSNNDAVFVEKWIPNCVNRHIFNISRIYIRYVMKPRTQIKIVKCPGERRRQASSRLRFFVRFRLSPPSPKVAHRIPKLLRELSLEKIRFIRKIGR